MSKSQTSSHSYHLKPIPSAPSLLSQVCPSGLSKFNLDTLKNFQREEKKRIK